MSDTTIAWTEKTWNPVRGCTRKSPGCVNCYAERFAARNLPELNSPTTGDPFAIMTPHGPRWTGKVELIEHMLEAPLHWRKPRRVFVNSMSDLFHESLPFESIDRVFAVMALCPHHTFQVLTKRADRMLEWSSRPLLMDKLYGAAWGMTYDPITFDLPLPNVWLGVSCEDQQRADERIPLLLRTPAAVRFVSAEPLIGPVDLKSVSQALDDNEPTREQIDGPMGLHYIRHGAPGLDWVIVGGESGPGARPCDVAWIRSIVRQCRRAGVACFVKQLGSRITGVNLEGPPYSSPPRREGFLIHWTSEETNTFGLCDRKGGNPDEWPEDLRVREYPGVPRG